MKTVQEYLRHAKECEQLASKTSSREARAIIANMAKTWRMLAAQREKILLAPVDSIAASNKSPSKTRPDRSTP
jgi:hypothetical protein